ncbi:MAG: hypothetical protein M3340_04955 [Actinomycetota bacterium]|nr:hypothetical protein [Actinomycetota bacterium]
MIKRLGGAALAAAATTLALAAQASATPVCTDGYMGGPPASQCGGRIFPEAARSQAYIQYQPAPNGFTEYKHGIEYLAQKYPRWISVFTLRSKYGDDAVSAGDDRKRSYEADDTNDGHDIFVVKITDHSVPDTGKQPLLYSLSVHGNERGGLEGGMRTAEDLAMAATSGGKISDGVANYDSTTGRKPVFHEYEARDLLARQAVYLVDFNIDGWRIGDVWQVPTQPYARGNSFGTDLNRQMPTIGRINPSRNPLQESEMLFGHRFMHEVADSGPGGKMAYGADVHGELTSQAYVDVMYPAGQFDSVDHRRLMAIAERTKSVIDATLYQGIAEQSENTLGGNDREHPNYVPVRPAHWGTVWDTLGYTDTGFIGDYMATDLGVTGMDYEIAFNHTVPDKNWNVYLQENHINATRAIIKTAMAYARFQESEFNEDNVRVDPRGRAGYVVNPDTVTDKDENGAGTLPGQNKDGKGQDGKPVTQRSYDVTNQKWFTDTNRLMPASFVRFAAADVAADPKKLSAVDSLVLADVDFPLDTRGRSVDRAAYFRNIKSWVESGGNLVLTDRALHALGDLGVVPKDAVKDVKVYQPYANIRDFEHSLVEGLRPNARQLVEAAILGYGIGDDASPMTVVTRSAWEAAGGKTVGTTGNNSGTTDGQTQASIGELKLGKGLVRIVGGALPMPTEENDHRYGLRDYAPTYSGLYVLENSLEHDAPGLGSAACIKGSSRTVAISRKIRGQRVRSTRVNANGPVRMRRARGGKLFAVVDIRRLKGKTLVLRISRRTTGGRLIKTKHTRLVCR